MWDPGYFARELRRTLVAQDPLAEVIEVRTRGKTATLGIIGAEVWVPLLRLSNPSAACNVMNLDVRHKSGWAPTFERGTPDALDQHLLGPFRFTWAIEAEALGWTGTSGQGH